MTVEEVVKEQKTETIRTTSIPGLLVIERPTFADNRGFFREVFRGSELEEILGAKFEPVQWNHSRSEPGVIRGLHAEDWNKVVYPVTGRMFAAIVDIRPDSPTFGEVETFEFDGEEHKALFIPRGLANSICAVGEKPVHYMYLVDVEYDGSDTRAIAWNDSDLAIPWPVENPILSDKDRENPTLRELFPEKFKDLNE